SRVRFLVRQACSRAFYIILMASTNRRWRWRSRSERPSVARETCNLIRQMSGANPLRTAALRHDHFGPRSQENRTHRCHRTPDGSLALAPGDRTFPWDTAPRYLLRDRDASNRSDFRSRVKAMVITEVIMAPAPRRRTLTSSAG